MDVRRLRWLGLSSERRLRRQSRAAGLDVEVSVHPSATVGTVHFEGWGPGRSTVRIGPRCRLSDGIVIRLRGGARLELGEHVEIRRGCILNVGGELVFEGENLLSWSSAVHAGDRVTFRRLAGTGEMVTVIDGNHYREAPGDHWYHRSTASPVTIGQNSWLGAKSTVTSGVVIGDDVTVAANSVVTRDVPDRAVVGGVPARTISTQFADR